MQHPLTPAKLGRALDEARRGKHLSIRATAKLADVAPATLQGWLNGKHFPTPALRTNLEQLIRVLEIEDEVTLDWRQLEPVIARLRASDPPYVGLRPFTVAETSTFFGRREEAERIARELLRAPGGHQVLAVLGGSGSGKSSVLAAGLIGQQTQEGNVLAGWTGKILTIAELESISPKSDTPPPIFSSSTSSRMCFPHRIRTR